MPAPCWATIASNRAVPVPGRAVLAPGRAVPKLFPHLADMLLCLSYLFLHQSCSSNWQSCFEPHKAIPASVSAVFFTWQSCSCTRQSCSCSTSAVLTLSRADPTPRLTVPPPCRANPTPDRTVCAPCRAVYSWQSGSCTRQNVSVIFLGCNLVRTARTVKCLVNLITLISRGPFCTREIKGTPAAWI
jgi:hypothetical protein